MRTDCRNCQELFSHFEWISFWGEGHSTKNLNETEKFYCSCLGFSKKFNFIRKSKIFGFYLQINESNFIEVFQTDADSSESEPQVKHFCLEVDDIDKTKLRFSSEKVGGFFKGLHVKP